MTDEPINPVWSESGWCPNCQTPTGAPKWEARETYLWANQYGYCKRVFCGVCGQWTDITVRNDWRQLDAVTFRIVRKGQFIEVLK